MPPRKASSSRRIRATRDQTQANAVRSVWAWLLQRELWGVALTALGIVTVISLLSRNQGVLSEAWSFALRQLFGVGAYPMALLFVASGVALLAWDSWQKPVVLHWKSIVGGQLIFFASLALLHIVQKYPPLEMAQAGRYGGYTGWAIQQLLVPLVGKVISALLMGAVWLGGLYLALGTSWQRALWGVRCGWARLGLALRAHVSTLQARQATAPPPAPAETIKPRPTASPRPSVVKSSPKAARTPATPPPAKGSARSSPADATLPSLDLLASDANEKGDDADARARAQIIEETLDAFGIPVQVTDWHRGPVVTQFYVEPGYVERAGPNGVSHRFKIRVSKILALSNDLALALAAAPIRIEAPVPGQAVVGIEVPNDVKSLVGLRGVLEAEAFQKARPPLRIALGRDVSGQAVVADLASMPHLLLAGSTGSGKSVCLNAIIASLLFYNTPEQLKLLMIDPKRVELTLYNGIPHLLGPVIVDVEKVIAALRWLVREMENRYKQFAKVSARNIGAYNKKARSKGLEPLPMIVVIIDELADLMLAAADDVERMICRLAQMARATGIHLVIATQRPSVDVVTGLIKANFPARIAFAVTSQIDSRVILDTPGAERLLGRGDMLFQAPDSPKLMRVQGCFVSDAELSALAGHWRNIALQQVQQEEESREEPWSELLTEEDESDTLLGQAAALVRQHKQASASFLQRQMRIGYPRAARLVDQLEKMGVIGPAEGSKARAVLADTVEADAEVSIEDDIEPE